MMELSKLLVEQWNIWNNSLLMLYIMIWKFEIGKFKKHESTQKEKVTASF